MLIQKTTLNGGVGWECLKENLNRDTRNKNTDDNSLFLAIKKGTPGDYKNKESIKEINAFVVGHGSEVKAKADFYKNQGYKIIDVDCNLGAGGNFVYLYYKS
jgi:F420-dependent methylenetetrahydromethanopterin dehydrogenase